MKRRGMKQLVSMLLALVMVLSLMPATALTAFAEEKTEITELSLSFMTPSEIPAVGEPIRYMSGGRLTENDDRIELTGNVLHWRIDDSSVVVNETYDDIGMYYEAGRTYNAEIVVEVQDPEQYTIGENTKITLTNPGDFTYTSEVSSVLDTGSSFFAHMKLTITMNGERTYPDITKVVFKDLVSPSEGMSVPASSTDIHYSNCQMTSGIWMGNVWGKDQFDNNTFVAGETYTYRVVLTARDGYKFDENATIQLTSGGVAQEPSYYAYTDGNRILTLDYTYTIPGITWVDCVETTIKRYEEKLTPIAGEAAIDLFTDTLLVDENAPYKTIGELGRTWYSEDGVQLSSTDRFEAGKTYYFNYSFSIKDEYRHLYRFVPENLTTTITGESYTGKGFQKAERVEYSNHDNTYVTFRYYFTAQFPEGAGSSAGNPAFCYSYEEFKFAMEDNYIRYVALGNVEDSMPLVSIEDASPYGDNRCPGIWVNSNKNLILLGDAQFTAPNATENVHRVYDHLIQVRQGGNLTISGTGSLTFHGNAVGWVTSVATVVDDSVLTINGGTVKGDTGNRTSFCYGVNVNGGILYVNDGTVIGTDRHVYGGGIAAVMLYDGVAYIRGGNFSSDVSDGAAGHDHYGLSISEGGTAYLRGGEFEGIKMPYAATMNDYVESGYTMTVNGVKTDPASCGTTDQCVEVYQEISEVDININAPTARKDIPIYIENVYGVPEGCTVKRVTWLEDGGDANSSQFVAGKNYTVEIALTADNGVRFANPLESATINFADATVTAQGIGAENGIILSYDFGICPATISNVALTIDPPKQNGTPDQTVACGDYGYKQATGNDNMWDDVDVYWEESTDGNTWTQMASNATFTVGKHYRASINVMTRSGNIFDVDAQFEPNVLATVNGYYAEVFRYPEVDPSELICVRYDFGILNDNIIEQIDIDGVAEPVVGEHPSYTCAISGSGYTINNAYSNGTYVINGIAWYDVTDDKWVFPNDTFEIGHEYKVFIDVKTEDGYEFYTTNVGGSYPPEGWGYINGNYATLGVQWDARNEQSLSWTFTCQPKTVKSVAISGLNVPMDGAKPDFTAVTDSDYYTVTGIEWTDYTDGIEMTAEDTFEEGHEYHLLLTVEPVKEDGEALCKFVANNKTVAYLNGVEVKNIPNDSWQEVTSSVKKVTIYYTFKVGAGGVAVSGKASSYLTGDVTIELLQGGAVKYTTTAATGENSAYSFSDVAAGTYTMRVSKTNHITREYEVVVGTEAVAKDVKICPKGDVNLDGEVNADDLTALARHVAKIEILEDAYALLCSDVDDNGTQSADDLTKLARYVAKIINTLD